LSESCAVRVGTATCKVSGAGVFSGGVGLFIPQRILALSHFAMLAFSHKKSLLIVAQCHIFAVWL
jgi:hypothetical protein